MQHCEKCKVTVHGSQPHCPLCQGPLTGKPTPEEDIFPVLPKNEQAKNERALMALLAVGSAGVVVICVAINIMVGYGRWWSLFVLGGVASFWLYWLLAGPGRKNTPSLVFMQTLVLSASAVLWDLLNGFRRWSVNFVVPILIAFGVLLLYVLLATRVIRGGSAVFYRFLLSLLGVAPAVLLLCGVATLVIPSVICVAVCALSLILSFGFEMQELKPELKRRMHF